MPHDTDDVHSERDQTDESLRVEREKVDVAFGEQVTGLDETADALITRARARVDELIAAARAKTDQQSSAAALGARVTRERDREDHAVERERAHEDELVREERAEQVALLSAEREETDRDLSSERARSDSALATRDEFLGLVSHDLRGMLTTVLGWAHFIETSGTRPIPPEKIVDYARRIQRAGSRMDRLIGDLVDVASIEAGRLAVHREAGDPAHVISEAIDLFSAQAAASGVTLSAKIVSSSSRVRFDLARVLQVVTNLLGNALKFTPRNGEVCVTLDRVGEDLRFTVRDTGKGIPPDQLDYVFERFTQLKEGDRRGVGLGLYIARCIVEGHGGRIWAESVVGQGSTFSFTLPFDATPRRT